MESWSNCCQTAVIGCCLPMPSLVSGTVAAPSPAHSLVHCSRSPAAVFGVLFCSHLATGHWRLEETVGSGPRACTCALWVAQSSFYTLREMAAQLQWCEFHKETSSCSLAALVVETVQFLPLNVPHMLCLM